MSPAERLTLIERASDDVRSGAPPCWADLPSHEAIAVYLYWYRHCQRIAVDAATLRLAVRQARQHHLQGVAS